MSRNNNYRERSFTPKRSNSNSSQTRYDKRAIISAVKNMIQQDKLNIYGGKDPELSEVVRDIRQGHAEVLKAIKENQEFVKRQVGFKEEMSRKEKKKAIVKERKIEETMVTEKLMHITGLNRGDAVHAFLLDNYGALAQGALGALTATVGQEGLDWAKNMLKKGGKKAWNALKEWIHKKTGIRHVEEVSKHSNNIIFNNDIGTYDEAVADSDIAADLDPEYLSMGLLPETSDCKVMPDGTMISVGRGVKKQAVPVNTNANGDCVMYIFPECITSSSSDPSTPMVQVYNDNNLSLADGGPTVAVSGGNEKYYGGYGDAFENGQILAFRQTAFGIQFKSTDSMTNAKGMLTMAYWTQLPVEVFNATGKISSEITEQNVHRIKQPLRSSATVRHITSFTDPKDLDLARSPVSRSDFDIFKIEISGAAANTEVGKIYIFTHADFVYGSSSLGIGPVEQSRIGPYTAETFTSMIKAFPNLLHMDLDEATRVAAWVRKCPDRSKRGFLIKFERFMNSLDYSVGVYKSRAPLGGGSNDDAVESFIL